MSSLPLFNVNFPLNAVFFFNLLNDLSNFNLIPTEDMIRKIFTITDSEIIDPYFEAMDIFYYSLSYV